MDLDKPAKKDKKYPIGKITKHERKEKASTKAGKHKPEATSDSSDDESSKVGLTSPRKAQELALSLRPYLASAS